MKKIILPLLVLLSISILAACSDSESYADKVKRERAAISKYLSDSNVTVISEDQFKAQDSTTDVSKNEFVLIKSNGVYLQIIRKGCGDKIEDGETVPVLCRFSERNLLTDSIQLANNVVSMSAWVEKMSVTNNSGTFTASFENTSSSLMYNAYGSTSVPGGWLTPLSYINVGRQSDADDEIAKVRVIVPHSQGQYYASMNVYPCLYDITYERGR